MPLTDLQIEQQADVNDWIEQIVAVVRPEWMDDERLISGIRDDIVPVLAKRLEVDERDIYPVEED